MAAGSLLYPFRTQKISLSTFLTVLKYASLRELWIAAILTLYYFNFKLFFCYCLDISILNCFYILYSVEIVFLISCCFYLFFLPTTLQLFNFAFRQIILDEAC